VEVLSHFRVTWTILKIFVYTQILIRSPDGRAIMSQPETRLDLGLAQVNLAVRIEWWTDAISNGMEWIVCGKGNKERRNRAFSFS